MSGPDRPPAPPQRQAGRVKVLLVEDSATVRVYVEGILRGAPDIELLPSATDGATGVARALADRPSVILMDLELPAMDGLSAIAEIMATAPCPIVVLSAYLHAPERDRTFESFQAGAVEVLAKPRGLGQAEMDRFAERLLRTVRVMAEARVLRRRSPRPTQPPPVTEQPTSRLRPEVVLIGASTGGPPLLRDLLGQLPVPYPLPIVICQHIVPGFEHGLATWLAETGHRVAVVQPGDRLQAGVVHVGRADRDLRLAGQQLSLLPAVPGRPTPSVDVLFETAAEAFGGRSVGLLLTGMGNDGSRGLLALRRSGAMTVTQARETCVIDGMPAAARAIGASSCELSPSQMVDLLRRVGQTARTR